MDQSEKILRSYIRESLLAADNDPMYEVIYRGEAGGFDYREIHPLVAQAGRIARYLGRSAIGAIGSLGGFIKRNAGALAAAAISAGLAYLVAGPEELLRMGEKIRKGVLDIFSDENKKDALSKLLPPADQIDPVFLSRFTQALIEMEQDTSNPPAYDCNDLEAAFNTDIGFLEGDIASIKVSTGRDKIVSLWNVYTDVALPDFTEEKYAEISKDLEQDEIDLAVNAFIREANSRIADLANDMVRRSKKASHCQASMKSSFSILKDMR